jgi:hypothetical protein
MGGGKEGFHPVAWIFRRLRHGQMQKGRIGAIQCFDQRFFVIECCAMGFRFWMKIADPGLITRNCPNRHSTFQGMTYNWCSLGTGGSEYGNDLAHYGSP